MRAFTRQVKQVSERKQHMRVRVDLRTFMNVLYAYELEVHAYNSSMAHEMMNAGVEVPERLQRLLEAGEQLRAEGERWLASV